MVLTGKAGKEFINEITPLLNAWVDDPSLKDIALSHYGTREFAITETEQNA